MTWRATVTDADELTVWSKEGDGPLPLLEAMVGFFREDGRADLVGWLVSPAGFEKAYMPWESDAIMRIVSQGARSARWTAVVRHRGNSLAVTVPADIARELGLKDGDEVDVEVSRRRGCRGGGRDAPAPPSRMSAIARCSRNGSCRTVKTGGEETMSSAACAPGKAVWMKYRS